MQNKDVKFENKRLHEISEYNPSVVLIVVLILIDFFSIMILENAAIVSVYYDWLFYTALVTGSIATLIIIAMFFLSNRAFAHELDVVRN